MCKSTPIPSTQPCDHVTTLLRLSRLSCDSATRCDFATFRCIATLRCSATYLRLLQCLRHSCDPTMPCNTPATSRLCDFTTFCDISTICDFATFCYILTRHAHSSLFHLRPYLERLRYALFISLVTVPWTILGHFSYSI